MLAGSQGTWHVLYSGLLLCISCKQEHRVPCRAAKGQGTAALAGASMSSPMRTLGMLATGLASERMLRHMSKEHMHGCL